jgi:uncharacterized RDD family membrane protein YckC
MPQTVPSSPARTAEPNPLKAPSLTRRMACWLYEGTLLFGVIFGTGLFFYGLLFAIGHLAPSLLPLRDAFNNRFALQAFVFVLLGFYFTWFWAKGQTLALKTWNIRVVDAQGQQLTRGRAFWRYLLSWLWLLPPLGVGGYFGLPAGELAVILVGWIVVWALLSLFHTQRQFLHDALAGTRLVHFKPAEDVSKPRRWWH